MDEADLVVDRPAFVIGTGRSGLPPLIYLIAYHDEVALAVAIHGQHLTVHRL